MKKIQNPFSHILETLNKDYHKKIIFGNHDTLKMYEVPKLCTDGCSEIIKSMTWLGTPHFESFPSRTFRSLRISIGTPVKR